MNNTKSTSEQIKVRACSIVCTAHPEWGTWGVMEDKGDYFEIIGQSGSRVLFKSEADEFWTVVGVTQIKVGLEFTNRFGSAYVVKRVFPKVQRADVTRLRSGTTHRWSFSDIISALNV